MATRNKPCDVGRAVGAELARLTGDATAGAPMCASCAFKPGTVPNGCITSVADAMKCVFEGERFWCHHDKKNGDPTRVCAGWKASVIDFLAKGGSFSELSWPYTTDKEAMAEFERRAALHGGE